MTAQKNNLSAPAVAISSMSDGTSGNIAVGGGNLYSAESGLVVRRVPTAGGPATQFAILPAAGQLLYASGTLYAASFQITFPHVPDPPPPDWNVRLFSVSANRTDEVGRIEQKSTKDYALVVAGPDAMYWSFGTALYRVR